jgi:hypothetical protein
MLLQASPGHGARSGPGQLQHKGSLPHPQALANALQQPRQQQVHETLLNSTLAVECVLSAQLTAARALCWHPAVAHRLKTQVT